MKKTILGLITALLLIAHSAQAQTDVISLQELPLESQLGINLVTEKLPTGFEVAMAGHLIQDSELYWNVFLCRVQDIYWHMIQYTQPFLFQNNTTIIDTSLCTLI